MEILLAAKELKMKPKKISVDTILKRVENKVDDIFYLDRANSDKDVMDLVEFFDKEGWTIKHRSIKFGLADDEYVHEIHIIR